MFTLEDKVRFYNDLDRKQLIKFSLNHLRLTKRVKAIKEKMRKGLKNGIN